MVSGKKNIVFTIIFVLLTISTFAQLDSLKVDSLTNMLEGAEGQNRIHLLIDLSNSFMHNDADKSLNYAYKALQLSQKFHDEKSEAEALQQLGIASYLRGSYENSNDYFKRAIIIYNNLNDTNHVYETYKNMGVYFNQINENDSALFYFKKALRYFINTNQLKQMANCYNNIGLIYLNLNEYDNALYYYKKSLNIKEHINDSIGIGHTMGNIGLIYLDQNNPQQAAKYIKKSLILSTEANDLKNIAVASRNLAHAYDMMERNDSALYYYNNSLKSGMQVKSLVEVLSTSELIAAFYEKQNQLDSAVFYYKLINTYNDSIKNQEFHQKIIKSISEYENKLQQMKIERQKNIRLMLVLTIGLIIIMLIVLLREYRAKRNQNRKLKSLNQKLMVSESQLKQLNHTKDKLFSIIAHDLKNPFIGLISISKVLITAKNIPAEEQKDYISKMYVSLKSLNELLENLLSWARSQLNTVEYYPEFILPEKIIQEVLNNLDILISQKKINIDLDIQTKSEAYADKNLLRIVIENLLSNALKFSYKNDNITIRVEEKNKEIQISVQDFGVGMSDETLKKVFKFKYLTSMVGTEGERGTGLGIHICKEFVEKNCGKIWVESSEGVGTIFTFTIPKLAMDVYD